MAHTGEKWSMTFLWAAQKEKSEISPSPAPFIYHRKEGEERTFIVVYQRIKFSSPKREP